jgi:hypothetical protein
MKKAEILGIFALTLLLIATLVYVLTPKDSKVQASCPPPGTPYEIVIQPHGSYYPLPIMLKSPATFKVSTTINTACDPQILLVMTNESYQGLTGSVVVKWQSGSISFPKTSFKPVTSGDIPPTGASPSGRYRVSRLKEYISVGPTETLWWTHGPFLSGPVTTTPQTFNITLPSPYARMLVYAIGKSDCAFTTFNLRVAEERAGFVVTDAPPGHVIPETAPFLIILAFCGALGLYALKRKGSPIAFRKTGSF